MKKNSQIGGRARQLKKEGFTFDIGPPLGIGCLMSLKDFLQTLASCQGDYYSLEKLSPAYSVYFGVEDRITIGDTLDKICEAFESEEAGSSKTLRKFIDKARKNYDIAIKDLVYRPGLSPLELVYTRNCCQGGSIF